MCGLLYSHHTIGRYTYIAYNFQEHTSCEKRAQNRYLILIKQLISYISSLQKSLLMLLIQYYLNFFLIIIIKMKFNNNEIYYYDKRICRISKKVSCKDDKRHLCVKSQFIRNALHEFSFCEKGTEDRYSVSSIYNQFTLLIYNTCTDNKKSLVQRFSTILFL